MSIRTRFYLGLAIWLAYGFIQVWLSVHVRDWWWLILTGFFGTVGCSSVMSRLVTGRWPDWRATWNLRRH